MMFLQIQYTHRVPSFKAQKHILINTLPLRLTTHTTITHLDHITYNFLEFPEYSGHSGLYSNTSHILCCQSE